MAKLLLFHLFYIYYNIVFYIVNSVYIIIIVFIFNLQFLLQLGLAYNSYCFARGKKFGIVEKIYKICTNILFGLWIFADIC